MTKNKLRMNIFACLLMAFLLCSGCASNTTSTSTSTAHEPVSGDHGLKYQDNRRVRTPLDPKTTFVHIVKYPGESLSIIAAWYTGDLQNWKKLAHANPTINPAKIFIGDRIRIPKTLIKQYAPMPQEHVNKFIGKKIKKSSPVPAPGEQPVKPEAEQEDIPLLFGPK